MVIILLFSYYKLSNLLSEFTVQVVMEYVLLRKTVAKVSYRNNILVEVNVA